MNLLQTHGAQPQKQPKYTPVFIDREFTGLYTQRNPLHDPSDVATARFYGGRPDALWLGQNIELTNRLTLQRRPGLVPFSTAIYSSVPLRLFPFQLSDGTIRVVVDTGSTGSLSISSVASSIGSTAVYTGVFPNGVNNGYAGMVFQVAGFVTNSSNNGTFICSASTGTTLTLNNSSAIAETHAATALSSGAVYWDQQNGSKTLLFGKSVGAGQTYFVAVAGILYMGDGVDTLKWTPLNGNLNVQNATSHATGTDVSVWNWGGLAPVNPPGIVLTAAGVAAGIWSASTWFSTMGLIVDSNGNIQQLHHINNGTAVGSVAVIGISSSGSPAFNPVAGGTTTDNTVTWKNLRAAVTWFPGSPWNSETEEFTLQNQPTLCYDKVTGCFFVNISSSASGFSGNLSPFRGYTAATAPNPGTVVPDNTNVTWMCLGNINSIPNGYCQGRWKPSQVIPAPPPSIRLLEPFALPQPGFPLPAAPIYLQENTTAGTTGSAFGSVNWQTQIGATTTEPAGSDGSSLVWELVTITGSGTGLWQPNMAYTAWTSTTSNGFGVVKDNNGSFWVAIQSGTSGASDPFAAAGLYYQTAHAYTVGTIIIDTNSNRQQVTVAGTSGGAPPVWNRNQGGITVDNGTLRWQNLGSAYGYGGPSGSGVPDNGVKWVNVGRSALWIPNQKYYLPNQGFSAPISVPLGGADINDGTNIEYVVQTGVSGSTTPTWNTSTSIGSNETYDPSPAAAGGVVWFNNGPFSQNFLTWSTSHTWAYSYKARSLTDFYSIFVPGTSTPANAPPPGPPFNGTLPAPTGSESNLITTSSPVTTKAGANPGSVVSVYGNYSPDPQIDTIIIWRDADGQGASNMLELTEIPNISSQAGIGKYTVNGVKYDWVFQDFLPDTPTAQFPGLNALIQAPINHLNDPPLSTFLPMAYNFTRVWGANGLSVSFSAGPDESPTGGNPNEAFPPADKLPFLAPVIRIQKTVQGLITFTPDSIELIAGGPQTGSFYSVTLSPGIGLMSFNALDVYAGELFFFSADNQVFVLSPSLSISAFGFPLGDQFANTPSSGVLDATWNPSTVYLTVHQAGIDNAIFVADGATGWYRLNPRQVPGAAQGPEPIWSPFAKITNGAQMVQSVEYVPGLKALVVGSPVTGGFQIFKRSLTVFTDNGQTYDAFFVMGSIVLAHPGQRALLKFLECDFSGISFRPSISFLANEIAGTFVPFTLAPQFDPPQVYGATITPSSYSPNRYYFVGTEAVSVCRHLQIKVDFGATANGDEVYTMTIYGRLVVED